MPRPLYRGTGTGGHKSSAQEWGSCGLPVASCTAVPPFPAPEQIPVGLSRRQALGVLAGVWLHPAALWARPLPAPLQHGGRLMGDETSVWVWPTHEADRPRLAAALRAALVEMERIHRLLSPVETHSDVARINAAAGSFSVEVSAETFALLQRCAELSAFSSGAFDITHYSMRRLWRMPPGTAFVPPDPEEVRRMRTAVDYRKVVLEEEGRRVFLPGPAMRVGLGGLARGYAVDRALRLLEGAGPAALRVDLGQISVARGAVPAGHSTRPLQDPRGPDRTFAKVDFRGLALSVSSDHTRAFMVGSRRYHPIMDPRTGFPSRRSRTAAVLAPSAMDADWMATAAFVLGAKAGPQMLQHVAGSQALWVTADNHVVMTPGMKRRARIVAPPTADPE